MERGAQGELREAQGRHRRGPGGQESSGEPKGNPGRKGPGRAQEGVGPRAQWDQCYLLLSDNCCCHCFFCRSVGFFGCCHWFLRPLEQGPRAQGPMGQGLRGPGKGPGRHREGPRGPSGEAQGRREQGSPGRGRDQGPVSPMLPSFV